MIIALLVAIASARLAHGSALTEWIVEIGKTALTKENVAEGLRWLADSLNARPDAKKDPHGGPVVNQTDDGLRMTPNSRLDENDEKAVIAAVAELVKEKGTRASSGVAVSGQFSVGGNFTNVHVESGGTYIVGASPPERPRSPQSDPVNAPAAPVHSSQDTSVEDNGITFRVSECKRTDTVVRCSLLLTNQHDQSIQYFELLMRSSRNEPLSYFVDNFGNQSPATKMTLGAKQAGTSPHALRQPLEPHVPISASITAAAQRDATSVHIVLGYFVDGYHTLTLHDVPITDGR